MEPIICICRCKPNHSLSRLELKHPSTFKGGPIIFFSKEDIQLLARPFKHSLVGKFSHGRPSMEIIQKVFQTFSLKSDFHFGLIDHKHILIRLESEEDFSRIWMRESWHIGKFPIRLFKWSTDFRPDMKSSISPIWISFPNLPIHFFSKSSLYSIAQLIGQPLKMDASTVEINGSSMARVCVEVDLTKNISKRLWIESGEIGFWQAAVVENRPKYYSKNGRVSAKDLAQPINKVTTNQKQIQQYQEKQSIVEEQGCAEAGEIDLAMN